MEYRNPVRTSGVAIDCEINHPVYGWIPFTADPNDSGAEFDVAPLYAALAADPNTLPYVAPPPIVPETVTPRQVRLLLLQQGLLATIEATIASMDQATQITWQYASEFRRDDPLLNAMAASLVPPLTSQQIDDFFIAASQL
jgi:hypothetical protein